jgi:hypothetical protein
MSTFNFTVDTSPMADQIRGVSNHVNATVGAVVAMQTAVILAEQEAANKVCNDVNKGFFGLIRSQISQKIAASQSEANSLVLQLLQQKNALGAIKQRMQRDYNMITSRYIKLFTNLNASLKFRVYELDKPVMRFAIDEQARFHNRSKMQTGEVPVLSQENLNLSQKIIVSNIKNKANKVIDSLFRFLTEIESVYCKK